MNLINLTRLVHHKQPIELSFNCFFFTFIAANSSTNKQAYLDAKR